MLILSSEHDATPRCLIGGRIIKNADHQKSIAQMFQELDAQLKREDELMSTGQNPPQAPSSTTSLVAAISAIGAILVTLYGMYLNSENQKLIANWNREQKAVSQQLADVADTIKSDTKTIKQGQVETHEVQAETAAKVDSIAAKAEDIHQATTNIAVKVDANPPGSP